MSEKTSRVRHWQRAIEHGAVGIWDLAPQRDLVHYSPPWKRQLGFPDLDAPELTSFWRCRVHTDDLAPMLHALRRHLDGDTPTYEMRFRLRTNGSGYHAVLSRGRVVARDAHGGVLRMVGTMVNVSDRAFRPLRGMAKHEADAPTPTAAPLHRLLCEAQAPDPADPALAALTDLLETTPLAPA